MLRAMGASVLAMVVVLVIGPAFIRWLRLNEFGQNIREEGPEAHKTKEGTPTMGGVLIWFAVLVSYVVFSRFSVASLTVFIAAAGNALIGFADDWIKIVRKRSLGLSARYKLLLQLLLSLFIGFVEAGVNPLVTTIYPEEKTAKLNALHAWWPGGLVIGSLLAWLFSTQQATWQAKMWIILIPVVIYGLMLFTIKFPATERVQSGVTTGQMYREALKPLFLLWLFCMLLTGAAELGTNQWISAIMKTFGIKIGPFEFGSLALAWISLVMLVGRLSAVGWLQRMNPVALLIGSSVVSAIGLILLGMVNSPAMAIFACFVFAVGVCYYWPTMLGFTSERFPAGGSFLLGLMGAAGMASAGAASGLLGKLQMALSPSADAAGKAIGAARSLQVMAVLPVILTVIFVCVYLYDQKRGGYKKVELGAK